MKFKLYSLSFVILAAVIIPAVVIPKIATSRNSRFQSRTIPLHTANRSYWAEGFDIYTDWETSWPETGVTRTYYLSITEVDQYVGADGVIKEKAMLINGQFPGPIISADWGDRINVIVFNDLLTNGTSIHWHGLRQLRNNINDGTAAVTECPIPPGHNKTYSFQATQYGTSWYHSHISSQYANGVLGPIQIDGPASCDYDIDLGVFPISDWYYNTADNLLHRVFDPLNPFIAGFPGAPPPSNNIFFNGTNVNPLDISSGNYAKILFTHGKRHRLRLINTSADNTFTVSIVGHSMTVIATDFVPVQPYPTESVYLTVGQRLDVVITADQDIDTYWLNATFSSAGVCGSSKNPYPAAIVQYDGAPWWRPGDRGLPPKDTYCADDVSPVPIVLKTPPLSLFNATLVNALNVSLEIDMAVSKVFWQVNDSAIDTVWSKPTLQYIFEGDNAFPSNSNIIELPYYNKWSIWLIENISPIPHPMHLHGHDFVILGRSEAISNPLDPSTGPVSFDPVNSLPWLPNIGSPIRRDTTVLPAFGWLVVAFEVNNPGAWVFHCHIAWHVSQGLSVQFLERVNEIASTVNDGSAFTETCDAWKAYEPLDPFPKVDSGL